MPTNDIDYNPYIHGTTSAVITAMAEVDYQLMPILTMLSEHQLVPMTGEITGGGFTRVGADFINDTYAGAISFGRVKPEKKKFGRDYSLDKVIDGYTQFTPLSFADCNETLQNAFNNLFEQNFDNFNLFLINYARACRLNPSNNPLLSAQQTLEMEKGLKQVIKLYQVIELLLSGYITPNKEQIKAYMQEKNSTFTITILEEWVGEKQLLNKVQTISMEEISKTLKNPTEKSIKNLLNKLNIPLKFFDVKVNKPAAQEEKFDNDRLGLSRVFNYKEGPPYVMAAMLRTPPEVIRNAPYTDFRARCRKHREILQERYDVFKQIHTTDYSLKPLPRKLNDFRVIFVTESSHIEPYDSEYRSRFPLKLGVNIHLVATEFEADRQALEKYFIEECPLHTVQVVLIDDLKNPDFRPKIREINSDIKEFESEQIKLNEERRVLRKEMLSKDAPLPFPTSSNPENGATEEKGYIKEINKVITRLEKEVKHSFFYFNIERKKIKIAKLTELKTLVKTQSLSDSITEITKDKRVTQGFFSTRTRKLLAEIAKQEASNTVSNPKNQVRL